MNLATKDETEMLILVGVIRKTKMQMVMGEEHDNTAYGSQMDYVVIKVRRDYVLLCFAILADYSLMDQENILQQSTLPPDLEFFCKGNKLNIKLTPSTGGKS
jgi:hypothetical protein